MFDKDGNGDITKKEMREAVQRRMVARTRAQNAAVWVAEAGGEARRRHLRRRAMLRLRPRGSRASYPRLRAPRRQYRGASVS